MGWGGGGASVCAAATVMVKPVQRGNQNLTRFSRARVIQEALYLLAPLWGTLGPQDSGFVKLRITFDAPCKLCIFRVKVPASLPPRPPCSPVSLCTLLAPCPNSALLAP